MKVYYLRTKKKELLVKDNYIWYCAKWRIWIEKQIWIAIWIIGEGAEKVLILHAFSGGDLRPPKPSMEFDSIFPWLKWTNRILPLKWGRIRFFVVNIRNFKKTSIGSGSTGFIHFAYFLLFSSAFLRRKSSWIGQKLDKSWIVKNLYHKVC